MRENWAVEKEERANIVFTAAGGAKVIDAKSASE
jgi:hypothetical protein